MKHYQIKYGDTTFEASEYQDKIFNNVENGCGNMVINAAAGASKTTTIVNCISLIPEKKRVLFVAFNKEIVEVIKKKITVTKNINVKTFHSTGYCILLENKVINGVDQINEFKYKNYIKGNIKTLSKMYQGMTASDRNKLVRNVMDLTDYCRYYLAFKEKDVKKIADKYSLVLIGDEANVVLDVLKWGKSNYETIDFTDMIWLPSVLNLTTRKYLYNWVLIDEGQDTSIAEQKLIEKCFKRGTRFIVVCDTFQQINVWCGSTEDAIDNFIKQKNTKQYRLPISYRCPKKIVEKAKQYSDNIIAKDDAIEGEVNYNVSKYEPENGDMVLCRNTAPLIDLYMKYIRVNKKSYLKGFDNVRDEYTSLIESTGAKIIDRNCLFDDGLFPKLYRMLVDTVKSVSEKNNLDFKDSCMHPTVLTLYDHILGIRTLSEGLKTTSELLDKLNVIFSGDAKDAILLSTVHKAKGLEADNVFILIPSLLPSKRAVKEWEVKSEKNLVYVAITRAKKSINYMEEDEYDKNYLKMGITETNGIEETLKEIEKKIGATVGNLGNIKAEEIKTPVKTNIGEKIEKKSKRVKKVAMFL